jgi:hypothetical protein
MAQIIKFKHEESGKLRVFLVSQLSLADLAATFNLEPESVFVAPVTYDPWDSEKRNPIEGDPSYAMSATQLEADWDLSQEWVIAGNHIRDPNARWEGQVENAVSSNVDSHERELRESAATRNAKHVSLTDTDNQRLRFYMWKHKAVFAYLSKKEWIGLNRELGAENVKVQKRAIRQKV